MTKKEMRIRVLVWNGFDLWVRVPQTKCITVHSVHVLHKRRRRSDQFDGYTSSYLQMKKRAEKLGIESNGIYLDQANLLFSRVCSVGWGPLCKSKTSKTYLSNQLKRADDKRKTHLLALLAFLLHILLGHCIVVGIIGGVWLAS